MHPNEKILRDLDDAMLKDDVDGFFNAHTDDVVIHVSGNSELAGTYKGKGELQSLFAKFMEAAGEFTFENHDYLANDTHGIVLQTSKYNKGGNTLTSNEVFICHFRDGKVSEFWLTALDQDAFDKFIG